MRHGWFGRRGGCHPGSAPPQGHRDAPRGGRTRGPRHLDTSAADADVPANEEFARDAAGVRPGTAGACSVALKAWATETTATPVDIARYDAAVRELRERDWRTHDQRVLKTPDGETEFARMILKQRGWTLFASFMGTGDDSQISLRAFEDACMKKVGAGMDQVA
ncbi:hypothetical protein ACFWPV_36805 [Streptomyces uncialis]|uniref:hypothetical protein n=1 Tax=Streptomyces uncialis TaxID=1048205 RepID=UPI003665F11D